MKADEIKDQIIQKQDKYIKHFKASYYHSSMSFRYGNFFFSRKVKKIEKEIASLWQQLEKSDHSEDKLDKIDKQGGWICPRCQKVHSWLSMTCDCPPNVITASTIESKEVTEIKWENNCNNCKWGKCLTAGWPCFDCDGSNKWEPINE